MSYTEACTVRSAIGGMCPTLRRIGQRSLDLLQPTIRMEDSELWFSWNPNLPTDPVKKSRGLPRKELKKIAVTLIAIAVMG
jgi:hypothetical protein